MPLLPSRREQQIALLRGVSFGVLVCAFLLAHFYALPELPLCLFKHLTQLPCPTCGLTRAFLALSQGDFNLAWQYHPLSPLLYLELCILVIAPAKGLWLLKHMFCKKWLYGVLFVFLLAWVFKLLEAPSYW